MPNKKAKRKILYIVTKGNWGGAQKYVYNLATRLNDDFDISVVFGEGEKLKEKLEEKGVRTIRAKKLRNENNIPEDFESLFEIREIIRKESPDIVHVNSSKAGAIGALASKIERVPKIIFTAHGWAFNDVSFFWQRLLFRFIQWATILLSHKTIAVSQKTKQDIEDWASVSKKVKKIYNGVEEIEFLNKKEAREKLISTKKTNFWIGTISELHKNKGLDILIKSFSSLETKKGKKVILVIIGGGKEEESLKELVRKLDVSDRVFFLGFIKDANKFLKAFDIYISSSRTEGLPFAVLEAGMAKLPVIATNAGGVPEIIKKGSGLIIERENPTQLQAKIEYLIKNQKERSKLSKNLKKRIKEKFSVNTMVKKTLLMYNSKK